MACPTPAVQCSPLNYARQQTCSAPHNAQQFAASWRQAMAQWLPIKVTPPSQWLHVILLLQLPLYHLQFNAFKPTVHSDHHHISPWNLGGEGGGWFAVGMILFLFEITLQNHYPPILSLLSLIVFMTSDWWQLSHMSALSKPVSVCSHHLSFA